jgi:hypothetical protein
MSTAYIAVTVAAIAANALIATADLVRAEFAVANSGGVGYPSHG